MAHLAVMHALHHSRVMQDQSPMLTHPPPRLPHQVMHLGRRGVPLSKGQAQGEKGGVGDLHHQNHLLVLIYEYGTVSDGTASAGPGEGLQHLMACAPAGEERRGR